MQRSNTDDICQDQYSDLISEVQKQSVSGLKFLSVINLDPWRNCTRIFTPGK